MAVASPVENLVHSGRGHTRGRGDCGACAVDFVFLGFVVIYVALPHCGLQERFTDAFFAEKSRFARRPARRRREKSSGCGDSTSALWTCRFRSGE